MAVIEGSMQEALTATDTYALLKIKFLEHRKVSPSLAPKSTSNVEDCGKRTSKSFERNGQCVASNRFFRSHGLTKHNVIRFCVWHELQKYGPIKFQRLKGTEHEQVSPERCPKTERKAIRN